MLWEVPIQHILRAALKQFCPASYEMQLIAAIAQLSDDSYSATKWRVLSGIPQF